MFLLLSYSGITQTLNLEQCKQMALEKNTSIQIKHIHVMQSEQIQKTAFTQFLPSLGFTGTYIRMNKKIQLFENDLAIPVLPADFYDPSTGNINSSLLNNPSMMPLAFVMNPETGYPVADVNGNPIFQQYAYLPGDQLSFGQKNNYLLNFGLIQPVFTGGKIRNLYKLSKLTVEMAKSTLSQEQEKQMMEIEALYWELITLKEQNQLAKKYKQLLETLIQDIKNYQSEGIVTSNELLKAQIKQNEAELNILKTENGMLMIRKLLCQKIGIPYEQYFEPADTVIPFGLAIFSHSQLLETATSNRQELQMLEQTVQMTSLGIKIMQSRFLPDIGLTANYSFMNPNPFAGFSNTFGSDYNIGIVMNVPIFHWGERFQTLNVSKGEQRIALLMLEEAKQLISLEIEQSINQLNESAMEVTMAEMSLELAEQNLRKLTDTYKEGMCKASDLLEGQVLWQESKVGFINAKANYRKQLMKVEKAGAIYK